MTSQSTEKIAGISSRARASFSSLQTRDPQAEAAQVEAALGAVESAVARDQEAKKLYQFILSATPDEKKIMMELVSHLVEESGVVDQVFKTAKDKKKAFAKIFITDGSASRFANDSQFKFAQENEGWSALIRLISYQTAVHLSPSFRSALKGTNIEPLNNILLSD